MSDKLDLHWISDGRCVFYGKEGQWRHWADLDGTAPKDWILKVLNEASDKIRFKEHQ